MFEYNYYCYYMYSNRFGADTHTIQETRDDLNTGTHIPQSHHKAILYSVYRVDTQGLGAAEFFFTI